MLLSNCWKTLKTIKLQRNDEIYINVNVAKAEKINCMRARLNPLLFFNGQSAAKSRIEKGSTTNAASHGSRKTSLWFFEVVGFLREDDIVWTHMRV